MTRNRINANGCSVSLTVERSSNRHQRQRPDIRVPGEQQTVQQKRVLRGSGERQGDWQRGAAGKSGRFGRR